MLVGADDRAIDEVEPPIDLARRIGLLLDGGEDLVPDTGLRPAPEAGVHRLPGSVPLGQVAPGDAGGQLPEDGVEDATIVLARSAASVRWEQG